MPLIQVHHATRADAPDRAPAIAALVTRLAAKVLRKREDLTAVIVTRVDPAVWYVGGRRLSDLDLASYALEIKVTDGTNTPAEKASFLAAVHAGMGEILGALHPESYVHVEEARGDAYGYAGITQARRAYDDIDERDRREHLATAAVARWGIR
ncbi:tautomerase family protein [Oharaeibacter diazotrophicus]|uniref:4-oxalocrotonate tautomerase n=1 Tax=Oharaeibacter diazotrophicus TaxID=1920512 RepID=A0A4V3CVX0_9HYPH|nr:tautomerase family protein [Oharaeibacter diazotrophicus]TDP84078.1 4-oxalocrotonate tautomerase [Oharaeibacter diazotrophicus]BBE73117.1 tautomerase enzyme [Pleomorphomonas sp. SM30]GLS74906.1 4-oxalocrotonate tautomerase [Oharaeibacter diazotrophicus]